MDEILLTRFEAALARNKLADLVQTLAAEDRSQVEIYDLFAQFRATLREVGRDPEEDEVLETMDRIVGWSRSPLFPQDLSNEEIAAFQREHEAR